MAIGSKITSKTRGMARDISRAMEGDPGIFHRLAGEHEEVHSLMRDLPRRDAEDRIELFRRINRLLLAHAHAEEGSFYPRLRNYPELRDLTAHCLAEHERIEELIRQLNTSDKDTQHWLDVFDQLRRAVEAHVEREEQELFPRARALLEREEADDIDDDYRDVEKRELHRLNR